MEFIKKDPLIILISGKARSGKDTIGKYLKQEYLNQHKKVVISPYTKYLKQYIQDITGKEVTEQNKPRDLLQQLSTKLIKEKLGNPDFFIHRQIEDIEFYSYFIDVIIIPDVRFPKEIEEIKRKFHNVVSIHVTRKNYISDLTEVQKQDITEIALDNYDQYDYKIENNNDKQFQKDSLAVIQKIKERRNENE